MITLPADEARAARDEFDAGRPWVKIEPGEHLHTSACVGQVCLGLPLVAPSRWAEYDKPCANDCDERGLYQRRWPDGDYTVWPCELPDCRDGRQVWELRTECPHIVGWNDLTAIIDGTERVLVARVTVQVVPVVHEDDNRYLDPPFLEVTPSDRCVYWMPDVRTSTAIYTLDPLPVPGRDFGVVFMAREGRVREASQ